MKFSITCFILSLVLAGQMLVYSAGINSPDPEKLLAQMTLREKIGQMILVDTIYLENDNDLVNYHIGGLFCGGDTCPQDLSARGWVDLTTRYHQIAMKSRLKIPVLFGIDAVHGQAKVADATIFPHNIGMGCTGNPVLVEKAAKITAQEIAATGFNWDFAPCIAVGRDERWGRTYECYSENPELVTIMGTAFVRGFSGTGIVTCAKHFIGDGGTEGGKNEGNTSGSDEFMKKTYLPPYLAALSNGTKTVMASFSSWNGVPMHANARLLDGLLKKDLKFDGFVVSDWGGVGRLPGIYPEKLASAVNAGIDMIMLPNDYKKFMENMLVLVSNGSITENRINDAVLRILRVKVQAGLFKKDYSVKPSVKNVGSAESRMVARQCVRESVVLLKNTNRFLPLSRKLKKIIVAGRSADSIDNQCGGWTIYWQGTSGKVRNGTTVLHAVKKAVSPETRVIYHDGSGNQPEKADAAIFVTGEYPYAETQGDMENPVIDPAELELLDGILKTGTPVAVVLISGRPMIVTKELRKWSALLAAWLPGTEADGIADVLFGAYNPTGRLSMSWPADMKQVPVNFGDRNYHPLFGYGESLVYPVSAK